MGKPKKQPKPAHHVKVTKEGVECTCKWSIPGGTMFDGAYHIREKESTS